MLVVELPSPEKYWNVYVWTYFEEEAPKSLRGYIS